MGRAWAVGWGLALVGGCGGEAVTSAQSVTRVLETVVAGADVDEVDTAEIGEAEVVADVEAEVVEVIEDAEVVEVIEDVEAELVEVSEDAEVKEVVSPATCQVGAVAGECRHLSECGEGEAAVEGFCAGGPQVRCCLPAWDRCSAQTRPGACLDVAQCGVVGWEASSGLCPGPAEVQCCTRLEAPTCDPSVRPEPNAGLVEEPGDPGCLPGMARIGRAGDFCIDRFEASLVLEGEPGRTHSPYHNPGAAAVRAVSMRWAVPQGYIDEVRAKAACANAGKRLCTSEEWLAACQGAEGWTYPYGAAREPGRCNDDRRAHVAIELFGAADPNAFSKLGNACLSQLPNSLDLAGENEGCQTPEGVYDLMGNLHEWIDDPAGTFRGGFFDDTVINGAGCLYRTTAHDVSHWDYSTGFRCCAEPL